MKSKLTIEYDGAAFAGWARQPDKRTVQGELERALHTILGERTEDGAPLRVTVAGRTDAGVHARGQVVSYAHEALDPLRLNKLLPPDIAVLSCEPAEEDFDARRDATSRTYCYRVLARRTRSVFERTQAFWWPGALDRSMLERCAAQVLGRHDFTAFTPSETEHTWFRCDVTRSQWLADGDVLEYWIEADMFLRHMVRVLVGTMLDTCAGLESFEHFTELLQGRPRSLAGRTAPAHALSLVSVAYGPPPG